MYSTLPVFLNRVHDVSAQGFGYMMSMNAAMVVLFQFWIIKRIKKYPPMLLMMIASIFYGIGYILYGFSSATIMFFVGMAIITIGEMIQIPVAQALTAHFAPENMRGRYMAAYSLGWAIPNSAAPFLAGLVMDNYNPYWVWFIAGILAIVAIICFAFLQYKVKDRFAAVMQMDQNNL